MSCSTNSGLPSQTRSEVETLRVGGVTGGLLNVRCVVDNGHKVWQANAESGLHRQRRARLRQAGGHPVRKRLYHGPLHQWLPTLLWIVVSLAALWSSYCRHQNRVNNGLHSESDVISNITWQNCETGCGIYNKILYENMNPINLPLNK